MFVPRIFLFTAIVSILTFHTNLKGDWVPLGQGLKGDSFYDYSGQSVSFSSDGSTVAIGASGNDDNGTSSGHVRIFSYDSLASAWIQVGSDINGESSGDLSGQSVSLSSDGTMVAIGASGNDGSGYNSGHCRVYNYDISSGNWVKFGQDIDGQSILDRSGSSVSLSSNGSTVAIGAYGNDESGVDAGNTRVYGYDFESSFWMQIGSSIKGESSSDFSGSSVSLSSNGSTVAIGAYGNNGNGADSGHVRIYVYDTVAANWDQKGSDIDGDFGGDKSGSSVALSSDGSMVAIGSPGFGTSSGQVQIYAFDTDGDGVVDTVDAFPLDSNESVDTDGDGTGNNADTDDDGDGVLDTVDAFPLDSSESVDTDGDGTGNNADTDDDDDGVVDTADAFPLDSNESVDTDGDGVGNNADTDDDGDGIADTADAFPLDYYESADTDGDGTGDNADAFPLDSTESVDTDGDGTGNNADTDDDGDGIIDTEDSRPLDELNLGLEIQFEKDPNLLGKIYATWERVPGVSYELEGSADLSEWTILETYPPTTSLSVESYELRPENPHHFVRLKLYTPPNANASSEQIVIDSEGDGSTTDSPDGNVFD